jgi:glycosyltransferase involved in cell wall biosynthesis
VRRTRHAIVVLNLPVPDDRRVWAQATTLRDAGTPVTVLCPSMRGHRPGRRDVDGIEVRYLRTYEGRGVIGVVAEGVWNTALTLAWLPWLLTRGVATLQVCNPPDTLFPLLAAARAARVRVLYDQHDLTPAMATARPGFERLRPLLELFERLTVRVANRVITTSVEQQRRLHERYGVDADVVRSAPHRDDAHGPAGNERVRLGYVGVVGEQEGLEDLTDATARLRERGIDVDVAVAGDGPYLPDARAHAERRGVDVTFTGWLQGDELDAFLRGLDGVVVSDPESEYNHHCAMNKVIEAMARGLPVVMRPLAENGNLAGTDAWVTGGWSIDDFADAIEAFVAAGPEARARAGVALRARYERDVAWEQQAARYRDVVSALRR